MIESNITKLCRDIQNLEQNETLVVKKGNIKIAKGNAVKEIRNDKLYMAIRRIVELFKDQVQSSPSLANECTSTLSFLRGRFGKKEHIQRILQNCLQKIKNTMPPCSNVSGLALAIKNCEEGADFKIYCKDGEIKIPYILLKQIPFFQSRDKSEYLEIQKKEWDLRSYPKSILNHLINFYCGQQLPLNSVPDLLWLYSLSDYLNIIELKNYIKEYLNNYLFIKDKSASITALIYIINELNDYEKNRNEELLEKEKHIMENLSTFPLIPSYNNLYVFFNLNLASSKKKKELIEASKDSISQNNPIILCTLGDCYSMGIHVELDYPKAFKFYERAAEQGDARAQNNLGFLYSAGEGISMDSTKAIEYYKKSAEQGYIGALYNLGCTYASGEGVEKDLQKAIEYFEKASQDIRALYALGEIYFEGKGPIPKDEVKGIEYFNLAAEKGDAYAQNTLGLIYEQGKGVVRNPQIAFEYYEKAAEQDYVTAQINAGICYEYGQGVTKNLQKAFEWYEKAAKQGHPRAQWTLGLFYEEGRGVVGIDLKKAFEWYEKAAAQGYSQAIERLAKN